MANELQIGSTLYQWNGMNSGNSGEVVKVTAKQFKIRSRWGVETRPIDDIGASWFVSEEEMLRAHYELLKIRARQTQATADWAKEEKRKFRETHAAVLTNVEG